MITETLIIGQGIAGSCLGLHLAERNKDFLVIDDSYFQSSSLVAAGLYNPMIFRKPSKSYNADSLIPHLKSFYSKWELKLNAKFHYQRNIIRVFSSTEEVNNWALKSSNPDYEKFLLPEMLPENFDDNLLCGYGGGTVIEAGNVDTKVFLSETKKHFGTKKIEGKIRKINKSPDGFEVESNQGKIKCKRVVLANGHLNHDLYKYLPLTYTKGDILTVYAPEITGFDIRNKGLFIMPIGNGFHRVGSTYDWDNKSYEPSTKARLELEEKLKNTLLCPFKIEEHQSGIRPTVGDRRPLLGEHPEQKNLFIFNGLGAKGVMLAPLYSEMLSNHIFDNREIYPEVDIKRYKKHYGNSKN